MTNKRDDRPAPAGQEHSFQGESGDLGYGYGSGDYGFRSYGQGRDHERDTATLRSNTGGSHYGKGPRGYQRSDARIHEDVIHALTDSHDVDASDIDVKVERAEVYLYGWVDDRRQKRAATDVVEGVRGVADVFNSVRIRQPGESGEVNGNVGYRGGGYSPDQPAGETQGGEGQG